MSILVLGGASWNTMVYLDHFPEPRPQTIADAASNSAAGSTGIGKALALKALGHEAVLHATIGADLAGQTIEAFCTARGLETVFDIDAGGTSRHVNLMNRIGERISIFLFNGSPEPEVDVARLTPRIAEAETIFLNITQSSIPLLGTIAGSNGEVWVDLHDYDGSNPYHDQFIAQADVIQFSDEHVADPKALLERFIADGVRLAICTRGVRGALALDADGNFVEVLANPALLVDSNGAGDCFCVALWSALRAGEGLSGAMHYAAATASLAVESLDLVPVDLDHEAVLERMQLP
jgi:sugar/nucleoside kinase (ribokinase family)